MKEQKQNQTLLFEYLDEIFMELVETHPFVVIFDPYSLFQDYLTHFNTYKLKSEETQLLTIHSQESPSEYLARKELAKDFDADVGWYHHRWIIHICGTHATEIEQFSSFAYYQELGETIKIGTIESFLQSFPLEIIEKGQDLPILEQYPEINVELFNQIKEFPIGIIKTAKNELDLNMFWLAFLQVQKYPYLLDEQLGPISQSNITQIKAFDLTHLLLELIWKWNQEEFEQANEKAAINLYYADFLQYLAKELNFKQFLHFIHDQQDSKKPANPKEPSIDQTMVDIHISIQNLIRSIIIEANKKTKSQKQTKKKQAAQKHLTAFIGNEISARTRATFDQVLSEWINQTDPRYIAQFQIWMKTLREDLSQTTGKIDSNLLDSMSKQMDFTGSLELTLAKFLCSLLEDIPKNKELLQSKIPTLCANRKKVWHKHAKNWWTESPLFYDIDLQNGMTIEQLWTFLQNLSEILCYTLPETSPGKTPLQPDWMNIRKEIWDLQCKLNRIQQLTHRHAFFELEELEFLQHSIDRVEKHFHKIQQGANVLFQQYYLSELRGSSPLFTFNWSETLLNELRDNLYAQEKSLIIFGDGLRQDLVLDIDDLLSRLSTEKKFIVENHETQTIPILSPVPSITDLGWNALIVGGDTLEIPSKQANPNIVSIILSEPKPNDKRTSLSNLTQTEREGRMQKTLELLLDTTKVSGPIQFRSINYHHYQEELKQLKTSLEIPVIWFNEVDKHEWDPSEFYKQRPEILTRLATIIQDAHLRGYANIYLVADHGFYFVDKNQVCEVLPAGTSTPRFCISTQIFTKQDKAAHPEWIIIDNQDLVARKNLQLKENTTLIFPKDSSLFVKPKVNHTVEQCYVHGGLSFQENDLLFLKSRCVLFKTVQVEDIEVKNPPGPHYGTGEPAFQLETERNGQEYLKIQVIGQASTEELKPTEINVKTNIPEIKAMTKQKGKLSKNSTKNYKLYFPPNTKNPGLPFAEDLTIQVLNKQNQVIFEKCVKITIKNAIPDLF